MENTPNQAMGDTPMENTLVEDKVTGKAKTPKVSVKALRYEVLRAREAYQVLNNRLVGLNREKQLPIIRAKYEGKYWKYRNGSGDDEWWLYAHCRKVTDMDEGIFDTFEMDYDGTGSFHAGYVNYFHLCQVEITKQEYMEQLEAFAACFKAIGEETQEY